MRRDTPVIARRLDSRRLMFLLVLLLAAPVHAATLDFPPLSGRVIDQAGVLSAATRDGLTEMLAQHERATGQQVVVVTLKSLQGNSIEDYGYQLGRHWGIGEKDKNTGALLIVAPVEHKVRIEAGYGLEGTLTDAASRTIIESAIVPSFRTGDFNAGVVAGTAAILTVLGNPADDRGARGAPRGPRAPSTPENSPWTILILMAVWFGFMLWRRRASQPLAARRYLGGTSPIIFRGGGFYGGGGGFSGGGGGFSGGGGSFGGGGASGGW